MTRDFFISTTGVQPVHVRRLERSDETALRDAIATFSNRTRYLRFFSGMPVVPEPVLHRLADVDGDLHQAWAAFIDGADGEKIVGAVHAMRSSTDEAEADLAIGLVDDWQGKGLSRTLVALLANEALTKGITTFNADVLWENKPGRALMKALGAVSTGNSGSVISYRIDLSQLLSGFGEKRGQATAKSIARFARTPEAAAA